MLPEIFFFHMKIDIKELNYLSEKCLLKKNRVHFELILQSEKVVSCSNYR